MTPVEHINGYYFKRDDKYEVCGVRGGKARAAYQLIQEAISKGYNNFVTAGSRMSPQCEIVSCICEHLSLNCHLFMPSGQDTSVIKNIGKNKRSEIHRCKVGYNSVICHEAHEYAKKMGFYYIPFGMECVQNIEATKHAVANIPPEVKRIVIPCGSAMSMISVLKGLEEYNRQDISVIGVQVGKDPSKNLCKFLGYKDSLFEHYNYTIIKSDLDYHCPASVTNFCGIELDPIYEAKCIPFIEKGDLLWIVGKRL